MMKKRNPTKQELQEDFHTDLSFEEAMQKILNTSKDDVEKAVEQDEEKRELELDEDE